MPLAQSVWLLPFSDLLLDKLWPLSRFVGYRSPPPPDRYNSSFFAENFLPQPWRDRSRERRLRPSADRVDELGAVEGGRAGTSEIANWNGNAGPEKWKNDLSQPSLRDKVIAKLTNMALTLVGSFGAIAFLALKSRSSIFSERNAPIVVAAFATESVLLFGRPESPLAQPRNVVFGNAISAVLGVAVAKLFCLKPGFQVGDLYGVNWAAAAVALSLSLLVMQFFDITHPPGGAAALLATTLLQIAQMSWYYVVDVLVSSAIILAWALVINNLGGRRYPVQWGWDSKWIVI
ncbi:hypothetical protein JCM21900_003707 [Sporobolomyces salmonicolor]